MARSVSAMRSFRVHVTGAADTPDEEILEMASASHAIFVTKEPELRQRAASAAGLEEEIEDDIDEQVLDEAYGENLASIMILN